ncbi:MAG TPA: hypothetical protein VFO07_07640 [Roseiflexaceae bacterium]|nr:hypothetical protein [Roseiflexaceae bacterium]
MHADTAAAGIAIAYGLAAQLPPLTVMAALLVLGMACLGMGNGAVFQLVPQRFQQQIGVATGVIGAVGGLGGFFLPNLLGIVKQRNGSFGAGFLMLAGIALAALILLRVWSRSGRAGVSLGRLRSARAASAQVFRSEC